MAPARTTKARSRSAKPARAVPRKAARARSSPEARRKPSTRKPAARAALSPRARKAPAPRKASRAPGQARRKAAVRTYAPKSPRASRSRNASAGRRVVRKPPVHTPAPMGALAPEFEVKLQKGHGALPLDPATGLPAQPRTLAPGNDAGPRTSPANAPKSLPGPAPSGRGGAQVAKDGSVHSLTYAGTGVDIGKEDAAIEALAGAVRFARTGFGAPLGRIGHFAGLIDFGAEDALVLCTDGVGSKVEIANALQKWDTVGIDCVAMNVNDCICVGAEPLAFVDYLAVQDPDPALTRQVGAGLDEGCRQAGCTLVGGETASLPGIIKGFDLAGTCLGHVAKARIVDGARIAPGDAILGLASSGIHSNGYSLARKAFEGSGHAYTAAWPWADKAYAGRSVGEVLLEPTRIYVREVLSLVRSGIPVHGLAHVTGSGLRKIRRGKPDVRYDITDPLPVPPVFARIQELGAVAPHEMYQTFNMGMGFVVIVPATAAKKAVKHLQGLVKYPVKVVGTVAEGKGVHHPVGGQH